MNTLSKSVFILVLCSFVVFLPMEAISASEKIGIVIMHGKGGSPSKHVKKLAKALEKKDYLVANIEMPWSGKRDYDVNTDAAEAEIEKALSSLRSKGAEKLFISGHSQGGAFALHFAGKHDVDGVIAIAPGGYVTDRSPVYKKLSASIAQAEKLVAAGKGDKKSKLKDYESSKGTYSVKAIPAAYLTWFDTNGAMNAFRAARAVNPQTPVLWIVAQKDYPGLRKLNIPMFSSLPGNPHTRLYEPKGNHLGAPKASIEEIIRWTSEVAGAGS